MALCPKCGSFVPDEANFCTVCGTVIKNKGAGFAENEHASYDVSEKDHFGSYYTGEGTYGDYSEDASGAGRKNSYGTFDQQLGNDTPSIWMYFLMILLFMIPIVGFISCIVVACGASKSRNLRNMAVAFIILKVVGMAVGAVSIARIVVFIMRLAEDEQWQAQFDGLITAVKLLPRM